MDRWYVASGCVGEPAQPSRSHRVTRRRGLAPALPGRRTFHTWVAAGRLSSSHGVRTTRPPRRFESPGAWMSSARLHLADTSRPVTARRDAAVYDPWDD